MMAREIGIGRDLQALSDAALHLDSIILRVVVALAFAAPVGGPERELGLARLLNAGRVDVAEVRAGTGAAGAEDGETGRNHGRQDASRQVCSPFCYCRSR